jgi:hypothetical protein
MRGSAWFAGLVIVVSLAAVPSPALALWETDGVPVCTQPATQGAPAIVSDGAGGVIIAWEDYTEAYDTADIYAQRVDASGAPRWAANGIPICVMTGDQDRPRITSDGSGGAIIVWQDTRGGVGPYAYAQRVSATGVVQWMANGVSVSGGLGHVPQIVSDGTGGAIIAYSSGGSGVYARRVDGSGVVQWVALPLNAVVTFAGGPTIVSDGAGGAIVAWFADRNQDSLDDIYAQRLSATGSRLWPTGGVAVCAAPFHQWDPEITTDGAGGAIIAWEDFRNGQGYPTIFTQRVSSAGVATWTPDGVAVGSTDAESPELVSDGEGGTILTYSGLVQRVGATGDLLWGEEGLPLAGPGTAAARITSDAAGGAVVLWETQTYDQGGWHYWVFAQRVNALGAAQWGEDGVVLSSGPGYRRDVRVVNNGPHGVVAAWADFRSGTGDIYAQFVDAQGRTGFLAPHIASVRDVPGDQGGWVRVSIDRSALDVATYDPPVATYNVWQRVDNLRPAAGTRQAASAGLMSDGWSPDAAPPVEFAEAACLSGWPITEQSGCRFLRSEDLVTVMFPPGTWELLGSYAASQFEQYIYRASTLADSSAGGTPYSVYVVSAHTTIPSVWFASEPDSGYSVDNIPPGAPNGLAGQPSTQPDGLHLSWNVNPEHDLSYYAVYRGTSEDFEPELANRVATSEFPEWFDTAWLPGSDYYYKVSAIDVHDNQSGFALLGPDQLSDAGALRAPKACYLAQNTPNPFGPETKISFGLSSSGQVSLSIYDTAGRLVRSLIDEERPAGRYDTLWDGRDANARPVASGIYYCRLRAGSFASTRGMVFTR